MAYDNDSNYYDDKMIVGINDLYKSRELCERHEEEAGDETPGAANVNITEMDGKN